jgi:hypothetical protein
LVLKDLVAQKYGIAEPVPEDVYRFIWYEGCAEGRILKYVLDKARQEIKAAVQKARMEGARVADPSRTNLVAGIGTVVTTLVAVSGTYGVALGPLAGGLSISGWMHSACGRRIKLETSVRRRKRRNFAN